MLEFLIIVAFLGTVSLMFFSWRQCVKMVLFLVIFEGVMRKWLLPQANTMLYFVKDAIVLVAYAKYFTSVAGKRSLVPRDPVISYLVLLAGGFILLQAANPNLGSILVGLVGARNYVLYIPLIFLVQNLFESQEELDRFLRQHLILAIPIAVLALLQHMSPPDSWVNVYASAEESTRQALIGDSVRVTGTFSYVAGYAAYLQVVAALVFPLLLIRHDWRWQVTLHLVLASIVIGMIFSGSRGPMLGLGLFIAGYLILNRVVRELKLYHQFLIPLSIAALIAFLWLSVALDSYIGRFSGNQDISDRLLRSFASPLFYMDVSGILGYGAGSTYQAAGAVRAVFSLSPGVDVPVFYESEPERIMLELGPIGFLLWYALRIWILVAMWRVYRRLKVPLPRELALSIFLLHLISLPGQMVFQITYMVYYWFLAGFVFLLPQLELVAVRGSGMHSEPRPDE